MESLSTRSRPPRENDEVKPPRPTIFAPFFSARTHAWVILFRARRRSSTICRAVVNTVIKYPGISFPSIRDFKPVICERVTGQKYLMIRLARLSGTYLKKGYLR